MLSRSVITFLLRSKRLLISQQQSPSAVILEPRKIKSDTISTVSPSIFHEMMGLDAMILVFWIQSYIISARTSFPRTERDMCTPMFIAALFIIAKTWKQPRCPSADEWIRKQWYIYTMEYYSAIKKNSFESVLMRWMKLEPIIQSEVSQKEKHQYSILMHIYGI